MTNCWASVQRVGIDDGTIEWMTSALKDSHRDEKAYHDGQIERLQAELKRIQDRLDAVYEDKLDGKVSEDFWERKSREWRSQQLGLQARIERHLAANQFYFEAGVKVLKLAQKAYTLWLAQPRTEKRKLLSLLQSSCTFDGTSLTASYRKPFCWLAEGSVRNVWRG